MDLKKQLLLLEPETEEEYEVGGLKMKVYDKMKVYLRDFILEWDMNQHIYEVEKNYDIIMATATKLINQDVTSVNFLLSHNNEKYENYDIQTYKLNEYDKIIELLYSIYNKPIKDHFISMSIQSNALQPLIYIVNEIFFVLVKFYEHLIKSYVTAKKDDKLDDLIALWEKTAKETKNDTSSIILTYFMHSDNPINTSNMTPKTKQLLDKFHYVGFCKKVFLKRLVYLLDFPSVELIKEINKLTNNSINIDLSSMKKEIQSKLVKIDKPKYHDDMKRDVIGVKNNSFVEFKKKIIQWYITKIFELRSKYYKVMDETERYYIQYTNVMKGILDILLKYLKY